jgi:hypothetical protein
MHCAPRWTFVLCSDVPNQLCAAELRPPPPPIGPPYTPSISPVRVCVPGSHGGGFFFEEGLISLVIVWAIPLGLPPLKRIQTPIYPQKLSPPQNFSHTSHQKKKKSISIPQIPRKLNITFPY